MSGEPLEGLDEKEMEILGFTLEKFNEVRYSDFLNEFIDGRAWSRDSLVQRIGSKGSLQTKGWLEKNIPDGKTRPVYSIPSSKELSARLIIYGLSMKNDDECNIASPRLTYEEFVKRKFDPSALKILQRLAVEVHSSTKVLESDALIELCSKVVKDIMKTAEADSEKLRFSLIIDYSPDRKGGVLPSKNDIENYFRLHPLRRMQNGRAASWLLFYSGLTAMSPEVAERFYRLLSKKQKSETP
jgi:hypothetical protein